MTHPILDKLDAIEADLTRLPAHVPEEARAAARGHIFEARSKLGDFLYDPAPGTVTNDLGAKITHRPDVAYDERARQAAAQGDADRGMYKPLREALAKDGATIVDGAVTAQAPAPERPAEPAKIGGEVR